MTRRENHGRSGGDRTRAPLLPKQVRYLCATLRYGRRHHADGHRQGKHSKKSYLPEILGRGPDDHGPATTT